MRKPTLSISIKLGQYFQDDNGSVYMVSSLPLSTRQLTGNRHEPRDIGLTAVKISDYLRSPVTISLTLPIFDLLSQMFPVDDAYVAADMLIEPDLYLHHQVKKTVTWTKGNRSCLFLRKAFIKKDVFYNLPEWERFYE